MLIPFVADHYSLRLNYPPTVYRTPTRLRPFHRTPVQQQVTQVNLFQRSFLWAPAATFISIFPPSGTCLKPSSYLHSSSTFRLSALHKRTVTPALTQPTRKASTAPFHLQLHVFLLSSLQFIDGRQRGTVGAEISRWLTALSSHHQTLVKHKHQHAQICDERQGRGVI